MANHITILNYLWCWKRLFYQLCHSHCPMQWLLPRLCDQIIIPLDRYLDKLKKRLGRPILPYAIANFYKNFLSECWTKNQRKLWFALLTLISWDTFWWQHQIHFYSLNLAHTVTRKPSVQTDVLFHSLHLDSKSFYLQIKT